MPLFSKISLERLSTCAPKLIALFNKVVLTYDCSIRCGFRNERDQNAAYASGASQKRWPNGNHNKLPSSAVDVCPYPIPEDTPRGRFEYYYFAGYVMATANEMGIKIRWGGDWDSDKDLNEKQFDDLYHFELVA